METSSWQLNALVSRPEENLGLKIGFWSLHPKIVIEAIEANGISWGGRTTKERTALGNLRDRAKGALGEKGGNPGGGRGQQCHGLPEAESGQDTEGCMDLVKETSSVALLSAVSVERQRWN